MLFRLNEVEKSYSTHEILRGVSFQINPNEKVGLVGRNGAGKTTVFKIITGEESPDKGEMIRAGGLKLGLLEQHVDFTEVETVHTAALSAFEKIHALEAEMRHLEHEMETATDNLDDILARYADVQHEFEAEGGFDYAARAEAILLGLGFDREKWNLSTDKLSGGQKNRLGMARLLLSQPDVLLLDEPTNHLDTESVEWLEEFLANLDSAYVIISHDRYFLDRTARKIIEIENGKAAVYTGNYSDYLVEREERREIQRRAFENQQAFINKTEAFVRKNIAGQKTKQAKSRRNMLERIERVENVSVDRAQGNFQLKGVERAGNNILMIEDLSVGYDTKVLARDLNFTLNRGEALGIIGANGTGKTTFLKTILSKLPALKGDYRWGTKTEIGYYAQQLDDLTPSNEIIQELRKVAPVSATGGELRNFLAMFLFTGDDIFKKVEDLSGGEKGRLALAKLIYSKVNVLVLDEPTNHLDIPSREALESALDAFEGTILTISHDRFFLDRVTTQILNFSGAGETEFFTGNYSEFHDWKERRKRENRQNEMISAPKEKTKEKIAEEIKPTPAAPKNSALSKNQRQRFEADLQKIEEKIAKFEAERDALTAQMSLPENASDVGKINEINTKLTKVEAEISQTYENWTKISEELEK